MKTVCHIQTIFESLFSKEVIADFAGGRITSDTFGLLLRSWTIATGSPKMPLGAFMTTVRATRLNMIS
jgi:hypothetical protein